MGILSALLFSRIQSADFYCDMYRAAVNLMPVGDGKTWWDVGCGPGLLTRLAAERGYRATGFDADPAMIRAAKRRNELRALPSFVVATLESLAALNHKADIISAASLLAVLRNRDLALQQLLTCLSPNGALLLIEPDADMNPDAVKRFKARQSIGSGSYFLDIWARTRDPARAVRLSDLAIPGYAATRVPLLGGMVNLWTMRAEATC